MSAPQITLNSLREFLRKIDSNGAPLLHVWAEVTTQHGVDLDAALTAAGQEAAQLMREMPLAVHSPRTLHISAHGLARRFIFDALRELDLDEIPYLP